MSSKYKTCAKCGVKHSAVVPHKCFKVKKDKPPELETVEHDLEKGGPTVSTDKDSGPTDTTAEGSDAGFDGDAGDEADGDGDGEDEGEADGGTEGENEGDGEGKDKAEGKGKDKTKAPGKGDGEGDGDGEEEGYGPKPQPPEPDEPPVVVVISVLKFAALTAQCAKNGNIEITLAEDGLFVYGHNGDNVAFDTIPWGELESRATLDGQFYVKEIIDGVDAKLVDPKDDAEALRRAVAKAKAEPKKKGAGSKAAPKKAEGSNPLTLPLTVGQRVVLRDGRLATVTSVEEDGKADWRTATIEPDGGDIPATVWKANGKGNKKPEVTYVWDAVADAPSEAPKPELTLPLTNGQKVVCRDGVKAIAEDCNDGSFVLRRDSGDHFWVAGSTGMEWGGPGETRYEKGFDAVADA